MSRNLRDFRCHECGRSTERFIDSEINEVRCSCGGVAIRVISMPTISLDGTDPDFPGAYSKWAAVREQNRVVKGKRSYREP